MLKEILRKLQSGCRELLNRGIPKTRSILATSSTGFHGEVYFCAAFTTKKKKDVKRNTDMNKVNALKNAAEGGDAWS